MPVVVVGRVGVGASGAASAGVRVAAGRAWGGAGAGAAPADGTGRVDAWPWCRGSASRGAWGNRSVRPRVVRSRRRRNCHRQPGGRTCPGAGSRAGPGAGSRAESRSGLGWAPVRRWWPVHRRSPGPRRRTAPPSPSAGRRPRRPGNPPACPSGGPVRVVVGGVGAVVQFRVFGTRRELAQRANGSAVTVPRFARIGEVSAFRARPPSGCAEGGAGAGRRSRAGGGERQGGEGRGGEGRGRGRGCGLGRGGGATCRGRVDVPMSVNAPMARRRTDATRMDVTSTYRGRVNVPMSLPPGTSWTFAVGVAD